MRSPERFWQRSVGSTFSGLSTASCGAFSRYFRLASNRGDRRLRDLCQLPYLPIRCRRLALWDLDMARRLATLALRMSRYASNRLGPSIMNYKRQFTKTFHRLADLAPEDRLIRLRRSKTPSSRLARRNKQRAILGLISNERCAARSKTLPPLFFWMAW